MSTFNKVSENTKPVSIKYGNEELSIVDNSMRISNAQTRCNSVWKDTDNDGKYDTKTEINFKTLTSKSTKLNEAENDIQQIQKKYIAEFTQKINSEKKAKTEKTENQKIELNGKIEKFSQGATGDCWALAGINALAHNKSGAKLIKEMISYDNKGNATVKFKTTNEVFHFSKKQINKEEYRLSYGDDDVRILEMAIEKHREKLLKTGNYNKVAETLDWNDSKSHVGSGTMKTPLKGGNASELFALLTGNKTVTCLNQNFLQVGENKIKSLWGGKNPEYYLSLLQNNPQKYIATTGFRNEINSNLVKDHEYSVISVDKQYVTVSNPGDSSKLIKIKKEVFLNNCSGFDICDMTQKD